MVHGGVDETKLTQWPKKADLISEILLVEFLMTCMKRGRFISAPRKSLVCQSWL
jgi:hypothetical protein